MSSIEQEPPNLIPIPRGIFLCPTCGATPVKVTHERLPGSGVIESTYSCPEHIWELRWVA